MRHITVGYRAQRYLDFGYAGKFKERAPIDGYVRQQRYTSLRLDAQTNAWLRSPIWRTTCPHIPTRVVPLLPRWKHR